MDYYKRYPILSYLNFYFILPLLALIFIVQGCKKPHSDIGGILYKKNHNKVFKAITADEYTDALQKALADKSIALAHPEIIKPFYEAAGFEPVFLRDHFVNGDLDTALAYFEKANLHGLSAGLFQADKIRGLLTKLKDKKAIKNTAEACRDMAKLELMVANSMINYSNALQFGVINPRVIYARYYTKTLHPDSLTMKKALYAHSFKQYLDSIQPKSPQYLTLKKALADSITAQGIGKAETQRILIVNLERLRWKNKPTADRYVMVNIPAYELDVWDHGRSILNMKVCVGEGRNKDQANSLVEYADDDKIDRPFSRETPQLNSMIYEAQVNPVWNIPKSIASKEIIKEAAEDPYYLSNKNINVYKDGKLIEDTETIDWSDPDAGTSYTFKQQPGADNALGRVKFLFPNKSSVYLHDTPAKNAFNSDMRAVSHGCVRLEKPLDFAHALFGDGSKYQLIAKYMHEDNSEPTDIALPKKMPVYITYVTCWVDSNGTIQYRPDVYGLDIVLYGHLQKLMNA